MTIHETIVPIRAPTLANDPNHDVSSILSSCVLILHSFITIVVAITFKVHFHLIDGIAVAGHE